MQECIRIYYSMFIWSSTCFKQQTAHHQELKNCISSLWCYMCVRLLDVEVAILELPMMSGLSLKTCWASYKHGTINSDTLLHLVGYFCMNYTMMHGSMNIKFIIHVFITILLCNISVLLHYLYISLPLRNMQTYLYFLCVLMDLVFALSCPMRHTNTEFVT